MSKAALLWDSFWLAFQVMVEAVSEVAEVLNPTDIECLSGYDDGSCMKK